MALLPDGFQPTASEEQVVRAVQKFAAEMHIAGFRVRFVELDRRPGRISIVNTPVGSVGLLHTGMMVEEALKITRECDDAQPGSTNSR